MIIETIQDQIIYSTLRIVATDGCETSIGTGFFVVDNQKFKEHPVLVTNKHVVGRYNRADFTFCGKSAEGKPIDSYHITISVLDLQERIIMHPDDEVDLCGILLEDVINNAINTGKEPFYICVGTDFFITGDILKGLTAIENVIMVGYPEGLIDIFNNKPVVRKGITATSYKLDYAGRKVFMIDMAVFHGSSGSPVFLETRGLSKQRKVRDKNSFSVPLSLSTDYCFVGVVYGVPRKSVKGELKIVEAPTNKKLVSETELMTNLGFVIKAEKVKELINTINDGR